MKRKKVMKKRINTVFAAFLAMLLVVTQVTGCAKAPAGEPAGKTAGTTAGEMTGETAGAEVNASEDVPAGVPMLPGLDYVSSMETCYAEAFKIHTSRLREGDGEMCRLINVPGSGQYLLLPEGSQGIPDLPETVTVFSGPPECLYVAATSSMALFEAAGALGQVKLTGTREDGWYIDAPREALENGSMVYAGKYSAPDYELLASSGCGLAVESMMILHTPEVKEKLEELGIPVFIDTSSTESHPLGRTEWVRLYGVLTGHEEEADAFFEKQKAEFARTAEYRDTGKTAAFFSISSGGNVIVRASDDYIPRMIGLAGGSYVFEELLSENGNSASVRLTLEDFYNTAKDADFLIYNATIDDPVRSLEDLCRRSSLLSEFRAVKNGNVWQVQKNLYQSPDIAAEMISDIHRMLTGEDTEHMVFLSPVR